MKKKALAVVALCTAAMLTACGTKDVKETTAAPETTVETVAETEAEPGESAESSEETEAEISSEESAEESLADVNGGRGMLEERPSEADEPLTREEFRDFFQTLFAEEENADQLQFTYKEKQYDLEHMGELYDAIEADGGSAEVQIMDETETIDFKEIKELSEMLKQIETSEFVDEEVLEDAENAETEQQ